MPYLRRLLRFLRDNTDPERWTDTAEQLLRTRSSAGGWTGRSDQPDLYWTSFALRCLFVLQVDDHDAWREAVRWLLGQLHRGLSLVDAGSALTSLTLADELGVLTLRERVSVLRYVRSFLREIEGLRTPDGGYGRAAGDRHGSTYQTFVAYVAYSEVGQPVPEADRVVEFLRGRRTDDGGYCETAVGRCAGTNPTAAAVAVLTELGALDDESAEQTARFLLGMRGIEGGFRANSRIPFSDLLSTFTALNALRELGYGLPPDELARVATYIKSLEASDGGFRAAVWDSAVDPEYTFYGVGSVTLIDHLRSRLVQPRGAGP